MPATGSVSTVPFWNVTSTGSPIVQAEVLGRVLVDEDAVVGQRLEVGAVAGVDVDELLERQRVDGADRLLVAVDERRRCRAPR